MTWDNDGADFLWGNPANWSSNSLPISTDSAILTDSDPGTLNVGGVNRTIDTLQFANTLAGPYVVNTGSLTLNTVDQAGVGGANNQIASDLFAAGSTLTIGVTSGMLDVTGKITATNLSGAPLVAGTGAVALRNTTNAITGTISISNTGNIHAVEPGSIGTATVALGGNGQLQVLSDTMSAAFGNNVTVTGSGNTLYADGYLGGVLNAVMHLGNLSTGAGPLQFQTRSGYRIAFNSTNISGNTAFTSALLFDTDAPGKLSLGAVTQTGTSSITLNGNGNLILDGTGTYTGGTFINGGMLTASVNGALGSGNVEVYTDGTLQLTAAQSPFPTIYAGKNGEKYAAIAGNLTGAIYSGGSKNVNLANDSILAITAGPSPVRGVDVGGAAYYQGITSNSQTLTVGDDGATSIYKGAAIGPYTPTGATPLPFAGTINGVGSGPIQVYVGSGNKLIDGATFNTSDPAGLRFFGPGGVTFIEQPSGTATTFSHIGNGNTSTQDRFMVTLQGHNILTSINTLNVSDGIFYPDSNDSIRDVIGAGGATVNINSGGTAYLYGLAPNSGLNAGNINVNTGGAVYVAANAARPIGGAIWNYQLGSTLILGANVNTGAVSTWIHPNADVIVDMATAGAFSGQGIMLGNGRRLTTPSTRDVTLSGGQGIKSSSGFTVLLTAAGGRNMVVQDNITLPGANLQVGDTSNFTTVSNFTTRATASQNGNVRIDGASNTMTGLTIVAGNLNVGDQGSDTLTVGSITQAAPGFTTNLQNGTVNLSGVMAVTGGTLAVNSKLSYGASSSVNVSAGALQLNSAIAPDIAAPITITTTSPGQMTASGSADPFTDATNPNIHLNVFNNGALFVTSGTKNLGNLDGPLGGTVVSGNSTLIVTHLRNAVATVGDTSILRVRSGGGDSGTGVMVTLPAMSGQATFDINDSKMIIHFDTNTAPIAITRAAIVAGRGGTDFGNATWIGVGGISSSAAAAQDGVSYAVGYVPNSILPLLGSNSYTEFGGQTVNAASFLIRYTLGADATCDGRVNTDDVTIVGADYNNPGTGQWYLGDFDYDGICDSDDVTVLGALYDPTAPAMSIPQMTAQFGEEFATAFARGRALGMAAVPEPVGLPILGLGALALRRRRGSRRR